MPTLIFLVQRKLVNQIFESKLSAGYLYAAPRQKSRFKETAICKHEGSRCCTIKGNLKERGKVTEGQNESKVKRFFFCCRYKYKNHVLLRTFKSQRKHRLSSGSHTNATSLFPDVDIPELCCWSCTEQRIHPLHLSSSSLFGGRIPAFEPWRLLANTMQWDHITTSSGGSKTEPTVLQPITQAIWPPDLSPPLSKNMSTISHVLWKPTFEEPAGMLGCSLQRFVLVSDPKSSGSSQDFVSWLYF